MKGLGPSRLFPHLSALPGAENGTVSTPDIATGLRPWCGERMRKGA